MSLKVAHPAHVQGRAALRARESLSSPLAAERRPMKARRSRPVRSRLTIDALPAVATAPRPRAACKRPPEVASLACQTAAQTSEGTVTMHHPCHRHSSATPAVVLGAQGALSGPTMAPWRAVTKRANHPGCCNSSLSYAYQTFSLGNSSLSCSDKRLQATSRRTRPCTCSCS
jgi:hypothetical protein